MAQQHGVGGQFGDTTFTKVFVGGLAWETQRDTMRRHFEQFGDILEAVIISDKNTGRSKGYGFVTFRDAEAARRACADASPIIDGRRANCNLAALGASRCRPSTPQRGNGFTITSSTFQYTGFQSGLGHGYPVGPELMPQHPGSYSSVAQGFPYHTYFGYIPYSVDYSSYSPGYYGPPYAGTHFPVYAGPGMISTPGLYPYVHFAQAVQGTHGYHQAQGFGTLQLPQMVQHPDASAATISSMHQQYQGMVSVPAVLTPTEIKPPHAPAMAVALAGGVAGPSVSTQQYYEVHSAINQPGARDSEHPSA